MVFCLSDGSNRIQYRPESRFSVGIGKGEQRILDSMVRTLVVMEDWRV